MSDVEATPQLEAESNDSPRLEARQLVAERGEHRWRLGYAELPGDDRNFAIEIEGIRRVVKQLPFNMVRVTEGSLHHAVAADPGSAAERFAQDPAAVVVQLLRETRAAMNKGEIENKLRDLHLPPPDAWWPDVVKKLKSHRHVVNEGARYTWSEAAIEKPEPQTRGRAAGSSAPRTRRGFGEVVVTHRRDAEPASPTSDPPTNEEPRTGAASSPAPKTEQQGAESAGRTAPAGRGAGSAAARETGRAVRQTVESLLGGRTADSGLLSAVAGHDHTPMGRLAAVLHRMIAESLDLDLSTVELTALPAPMRYDLGRLALRGRSWPALVQCLFAAEAGDTARLLSQSTPDSALLESLATSAEALKRIDPRHTDRWELILRNVADALQQDSSLAGPVLGLLASLGRLSLAEHRGLTHAAQDLLHDALSCREALPALGGSERQAALALVTSAIARPGRDHRLTWVQLVLALDEADRGDVLASPAAWSPTDLGLLRDRPRLASVLEKHGVGERILPAMLESALKQPSASDVIQLLGLPAPVLKRVPPATLAALLQRLTQEEDSPLAGVLTMLVDRLQHTATRSSADEAAEQAAQSAAEAAGLRAALAAEQESHDHARRQLAAFRAEDRHEDTTAVTQARLQTLQVVVDLAEETRLAAAAAPDSAGMGDLVSRLTPLLSAQSIRTVGTAGDVMPYEPARFRVLGDGVALEADDPAVVVRPAYVLSDGSETVLRHGEVRPSSRGGS